MKDVAESSLKKAMMDGDIEEEGAVVAGQIAPLIKSVRSALEIIDSTISECQEILAQLPTFVFSI